MEELKVDKSKLRIKDFIVYDIGHLPGRFSRRKEARFNHWALAYIADGNGNYQVNGGLVRPVTKGDLFFVYPHTVFNYGPVEGSSWEEFYISFEGSRISEFVENGLLRED